MELNWSFGGGVIIPGIFAQRQRAVTIYLDAISPAPRVAYSLRKVISTATMAIRVRRSSDNAQQDIGFAGDTLDTAALAAFVGAGSAFVTTFYDQTATGINMVQATASAQPRIVNAGVFDETIVFDGSNDSMRSAQAVPFNTGYMTFCSKIRLPSSAAVAIFFEASTNYNSNLGSFIWYTENNLHSIGVNGGFSWRRDFSISNATNLRTITCQCQMAIADATLAQQRFRAAGADISPSHSQGTPATPPVNFAANTLYLGSRGGVSYFSQLKIDTLVVYAENTGTSVAAIESVVSA